jgi:hypothetical protein
METGMAKTVTCLFLTAGMILTPSLAVTASAMEREGGIATYRNERHGFSLSYPAAVFSEQPLQAPAEGRVFASRDGSARLLAGALANADGLSLRDYRALVLQQSYPGAQIDYAPVRDSWFVVSGTRGGVTFYERVTFTCGGRLINSWAMLYPASERIVYDRIVEHVARSYRPGREGCG